MKLVPDKGLSVTPTDIAKMSRPYQQIKAIQRADNPQLQQSVPNPSGANPSVSAPESASPTESAPLPDSDPAPRKRRPKTNWTEPNIWIQIRDAGEACRPAMRPCDIVRLLQQRNMSTFQAISEQVVGRMIDHSGAHVDWRDDWLRKVDDNGVRPGGQVTRLHILVRCSAFLSDMYHSSH